VYCGSSNDADPKFLQAAFAFGAELAKTGLRMVYGGGGVGLMGECARGAHEAGGRVLGIIPGFLTSRERKYDLVETVVVENMHERKMMLFEESDAFVVLPGGVGTLEEIVELLSWRRMDLHNKPVVFYDPRDFWKPLYDLFQHTVDEKLSPPDIMKAWRSTDDVRRIIPLLREIAGEAPIDPDEATLTQLT
jgi:hypothetical protein